MQVGSGYEVVPDDPPNENQPKDAPQGFRFIVPLFVHSGIIHLVIVMVIQWHIGTDIERQVGLA